MFHANSRHHDDCGTNDHYCGADHHDGSADDDHSCANNDDGSTDDDNGADADVCSPRRAERNRRG